MIREIRVVIVIEGKVAKAVNTLEVCVRVWGGRLALAMKRVITQPDNQACFCHSHTGVSYRAYASRHC